MREKNLKIERREFLELTGLAVASAELFAAHSVKAQRPLPKSEYDYVDWSWEKWWRIVKATRPRILSEQTGKAELINLLATATEKITTPQGWQRRRTDIKNRLRLVLGDAPVSKPSLAVKLIEESSHDGYILRKLIFQTEPNEFVPSYMLIPKDLRGKAPAIICPHQTTQVGKREPAGLAGNPELHTALHLVRRGYVTFTYDALCFGDRHDPAGGHYGDAIPFYLKHPNWSLLGKMIWDLGRAIDYLQTVDMVDGDRIASIGHSHGGITTLFAMAFDERIKAGVSNCGFDTFRIDGNVWRWSHATALMPRLGFFVKSPYINMDFYRAVPDAEVIHTPFEMHEMLSLIAPRPLFLSTSDEDFVFPNGGWSARRTLARIKPVYSMLGAGENIEGHFFDGGHSFPKDVSSRAYEWLDRRLK
ncbi:MAG TPA: alpha/beta hydrolase family protein [Pyrinomonadaceae bacterium]